MIACMEEAICYLRKLVLYTGIDQLILFDQPGQV